MRRALKSLYWYHATRAVAISLILYGTMIEEDPGNRGTCITAAIGLLAAEPVGRREKALPNGNGRKKGPPGGVERRSSQKDDRTG